jgi:predicted RNA binding protein YcfA (HicA-like mRNA interferase family)
VREIIQLIERDGWRQARTRGSHRQYKHAVKKGLVTISGNMGDEMAAGTLNRVLKQAGSNEISSCYRTDQDWFFQLFA